MSEIPASEPNQAESDKTPKSATVVDEGLPGDFELTPELVEEEAIRGDFVLRWAAVLLAVLTACTVITHTQTLVEVKAGEYLLSNGIIPDGTDPFSYTTEGRVWRNHAWLFDIVLAGVNSIGGAIGITIFKALLAGLAFWCVVTISRPNTPTWWNAITVAIGAFACLPFFTARPELVTLVGCALLLKLLHAWRYNQTTNKYRNGIVVLFLFWSNLDPRMYLGLLLLIVFFLGEALRKKERPESPLFDKKELGIVIGISLVAALINPFGWHSLLSAWETHAVLDPISREYYANTSLRMENLYQFNLLNEIWWEFLTIPFVAALVVGSLALIGLYLNYTGLNPSHILLFLTFGGLAFATGRELGPAVIVCCVIANLNCQDWYRESFKQEYSVRKLELLFSRGGRALTVISFVGLAYLAISGRAFNGFETHVGFGFENILGNSLKGISEELDDSFDDRPFNFTVSQGDMLIWADQKVFIDSRLGLYAGAGDADLIDKHNRTRRALRLKREGMEGTGEPEVWKPILDEYEVTHALPRIAGRQPDYLTYNDLMANPDWRLTHLGPAVASFYRTDLKNPELAKYFETHKLNFSEDAFGPDEPELAAFARGVFPNPVSAYEKYLTSRREIIPEKLVLANHYSQHLEQASRGFYQLDIKTELAFAYLAIQNINLALAENPESASAFRTLGQLYYYLGLTERNYAERFRFPYDTAARYFQSTLALNQSLICEPNHLLTLQLLREQYRTNGRLELARQTAIQIEELTRGNDLFEPQQVEQNLTLIEELSKQLDPILEEAKKQQANENVHPLALVTELTQRGCHVSAFEILKAHPELRQPPETPEQQQVQFQAELLWGALQLELGLAEAAYTTLLKLEPVFEQMGNVDGFRIAAFAALGHADYTQALSLLKSILEIRQQQGMSLLMRSLPLAMDPEAYVLTRGNDTLQYLSETEESLAATLWWMAVYELERGQTSRATEYLHRILEVAPETSYRPLVGMYLLAIADEEIEIMPPSELIPITPEIFAEEPEAGTDSSSDSPEPGE